ncbi:MAG: bifunctional diaminohydroxyphosphoribosylaminopyrimidine deaminase/5-amino-6-(5-phosphoribosylamino)uracil reductase RibD [Candidatus Methylacidiphilales bacterium]
MTVNDTDEHFMRRCIELACRVSEEETRPNPRVGAILVHNGKIVAEGFHACDGAPHAERMAIESLDGAVPDNSTLYVTLEPCSTHGRTGACTDRILACPGIHTVVVGTVDPNPMHRGCGLEWLRKKGLTVREGCLASECEALNPLFNDLMMTARQTHHMDLL